VIISDTQIVKVGISIQKEKAYRGMGSGRKGAIKFLLHETGQNDFRLRSARECIQMNKRRLFQVFVSATFGVDYYLRNSCRGERLVSGLLKFLRVRLSGKFQAMDNVIRPHSPPLEHNPLM